MVVMEEAVVAAMAGGLLAVVGEALVFEARFTKNTRGRSEKARRERFGWCRRQGFVLAVVFTLLCLNSIRDSCLY